MYVQLYPGTYVLIMVKMRGMFTPPAIHAASSQAGVWGVVPNCGPRSVLTTRPKSHSARHPHSHRSLQKIHPKMTNIASVTTQAAANTPLQKVTTHVREPQLIIQNQSYYYVQQDR